MSDDYRPLPTGLKIKDSNIHGQGLFTEVDLEQDWILGKGYLIFNDKKIRLPLGAFLNHSRTPNVAILEYADGPFSVRDIFTIRDIKAGEELTINYDDPSNINNSK